MSAILPDFDGGAVADDLDEDADYPDPITSASVVWNDSPGAEAYEYEAGYLLAPGNYLLALTCNAGDDDAIADQFNPASPAAQEIGFIAERTVDVEADATADGSFPPSP